MAREHIRNKPVPQATFRGVPAGRSSLSAISDYGLDLWGKVGNKLKQ